MKPSSTLYELIHSINPAEKELFLKSAALQQGDKNYIKLFNYLLSTNEYDEQKLKDYFKNESFGKHIASEKNQLQKHILRSLRESRIKQKNSAKAYEKIKNVRILAERGLLEQANIEAQSIKQLANKEELFYALLDLIETEILLVNKYYPDCSSRVQKLDQLLQEKDICLKKIMTLTRYQEIMEQVQFYFDRNILIHDKSKKHILDNFINHELLADVNNTNSIKSLLLATYSRIICFRLTWDNQRLGNEINKALELFLYHGFLIEEYPKLYIHLYGFYARYAAITANLLKAKEAIDHLRNIKSHSSFQTNDLQNTIFTRLSIYDLMYFNYSGNYAVSLNMAYDIEKILKEKKNRLPSQELTTINFLLFVSHFASNQYKQSLKYINEISNSDYETSRQDLFRLAKICNLIVHYELKNFDYLEYSFKSVKRFFAKIEYPFEYENAFMKFFKHIAISKKQTTVSDDLFLDFKNKLLEIFKDPHQVIASEYFDMIAWLNGHIHNTSYAQEVVKQRQQT